MIPQPTPTPSSWWTTPMTFEAFRRRAAEEWPRIRTSPVRYYAWTPVDERLPKPRPGALTRDEELE